MEITTRIKRRVGAVIAAIGLAGTVAVATAPIASAYTVLTFQSGVPCYAYDDAGGSKTLVGYLEGEFHVANDGSTATLADALQYFSTRTWVQTSSRWSNMAGTSWVNGYSGTYSTGTRTGTWNPDAWFWYVDQQGWGKWTVQGYAASRTGLKYRCTVVAAP